MVVDKEKGNTNTFMALCLLLDNPEGWLLKGAERMESSPLLYKFISFIALLYWALRFSNSYIAHAFIVILLANIARTSTFQMTERKRKRGGTTSKEERA